MGFSNGIQPGHRNVVGTLEDPLGAESQGDIHASGMTAAKHDGELHVKAIVLVIGRRETGGETPVRVAIGYQDFAVGELRWVDCLEPRDQGVSLGAGGRAVA